MNKKCSYSASEVRTLWRYTNMFIKTCKAGLVLSVTRILRRIPCVCMCVCMYVCMYVIKLLPNHWTDLHKIIPENRAFYADCYRLLRFEIFTKYDEYFVLESAPLLHWFAIGSAAASLATLMTSQLSDERGAWAVYVGQKSEFSELVFSELRVQSVPVNSEVETRKFMKIQVNKENGEILRSHTSLSAFKNTQRYVVLYSNEISDGERRVR